MVSVHQAYIVEQWKFIGGLHSASYHKTYRRELHESINDVLLIL
jgi:hypothetical protein